LSTYASARDTVEKIPFVSRERPPVLAKLPQCLNGYFKFGLSTPMHSKEHCLDLAHIFHHKLTPFVIVDKIKSKARLWVLAGAKKLSDFMPEE
jgi:hypothetical protein